MALGEAAAAEPEAAREWAAAAEPGAARELGIAGEGDAAVGEPAAPVAETSSGSPAYRPITAGFVRSMAGFLHAQLGP